MVGGGDYPWDPPADVWLDAETGSLHHKYMIFDVNETFRMGLEFTWRRTEYRSLPNNEGLGCHTQFQWRFEVAGATRYEWRDDSQALPSRESQRQAELPVV